MGGVSSLIIQTISTAQAHRLLRSFRRLRGAAHDVRTPHPASGEAYQDEAVRIVATRTGTGAASGSERGGDGVHGCHSAQAAVLQEDRQKGHGKSKRRKHSQQQQSSMPVLSSSELQAAQQLWLAFEETVPPLDEMHARACDAILAMHTRI